MEARKLTLVGSLVGDLWMPGVRAQMEVREDLGRMAARFVHANGSGLVDAIKSVVDGAGDFRAAKLTADSFVQIDHDHIRPYTSHGLTITRNTRYVDVNTLPSLAEYVSDEYAEVAE